MYFEGSKLNFHKDRPSCEIILSHCHYGKPWKIYVEEEAFMTETGTSICYEGNKNVHGRITPIANNALYSFYSWVEKDGEYLLSETINRCGLPIVHLSLDTILHGVPALAQKHHNRQLLPSACPQELKKQSQQ